MGRRYFAESVIDALAGSGGPKLSDHLLMKGLLGQMSQWCIARCMHKIARDDPGLGGACGDDSKQRRDH